MEQEMVVKVVCGALALLCVGIIVMRRKGKKGGSDAGDDF